MDIWSFISIIINKLRTKKPKYRAFNDPYDPMRITSPEMIIMIILVLITMSGFVLRMLKII